MKKLNLALFAVLLAPSFASANELTVDLSAKAEKPVLLKLIQSINAFSDGSSGHGTLDVKLNCFMSSTDQLCTISDLSNSGRESSIDLSKTSERPVLLKLIRNINSFTNGSQGGHGTLDVKFSCIMSRSDQSCTISDLE